VSALSLRHVYRAATPSRFRSRGLRACPVRPSGIRLFGAIRFSFALAAGSPVFGQIRSLQNACYFFGEEYFGPRSIRIARRPLAWGWKQAQMRGGDMTEVDDAETVGRSTPLTRPSRCPPRAKRAREFAARCGFVADRHSSARVPFPTNQASKRGKELE
jgi:hypothetical protein